MPTIGWPATLPSGQGFAEFYGYLQHGAAHDYYYDYMWRSDGIGGATTVATNQGGPGATPEYTHDLISRRSEEFIRDHAGAAAAGTTPFYLQVSYTIPHFDLDDIDTAAAMQNLAGDDVFPAGLAQYADASGLSQKEKQHAAMISRMDASVGALRARLEDPNGDGNTADSVLNNTLIMFSSDNGTTPEDGLGPAGVNNPGISGGLKGGKRDLYEGGIRMPSFAYWEGTIAADGSTDMLNDVADFPATAADLAGTNARVGIDGVSILPTLLGQEQAKRRDYLLFENTQDSQMGIKNSDWTLLRGDMKLIKFRDQIDGADDFELYDVAADPNETSPLDLTVPANAALKAELEAIALAEGAAQSNDTYFADFRDWSGADGGSINDGNQWVVTDDPSNSNVGTITSLWSARVRNTGSSDAVAEVTQSTATLGFEVSGVTAVQSVEVGSGMTLTGRNEVRVGEHGVLHLQRATVESNRWVDVQAGGALTGAGTIATNLYNAGTLAAESIPTAGGDFTVAVDFSGIGNEPDKDARYTPLTTTIAQGVVSLDYGPSAGSNLTDRGVTDFPEEFNLAGWASGSDLASAIAGDAFVSLTVAPASGLSVELRSAGFEFWRNGVNSPTGYAIMTSVDGFEAGQELGTTQLTTAGSDNATRLSVAGTAGAATSGPLEVRLYGWGANSTAENGHTHLTAADVGLRFATLAEATFSPVGTFDVAGDFYHLDGGRLAIDVGGLDNSNPVALQFDAVEVAGKVVLAGELALNLLDNFVIREGDQVTFLTGQSISGVFSDLIVTGAGDWQTNLIYGSDSVTARFTAVPEPTAVLLAGLGLGSLGLAWRRRRAGKHGAGGRPND